MFELECCDEGWWKNALLSESLLTAALLCLLLFLSSSLQSLVVRFARFLSDAAVLSHEVKKPRNGSGRVVRMRLIVLCSSEGQPASVSSLANSLIFSI